MESRPAFQILFTVHISAADRDAPHLVCKLRIISVGPQNGKNLLSVKFKMADRTILKIVESP